VHRCVVEMKHASELLLRWGDIVALRAEHDDWSADIAQVDRCSIRRLDPAGSEIIADKQLINDELNFFSVQIDVATPPLFESQIARSLSVYLRIKIVLLGPQRIGRVLVLEILHQPGAVELAV